MTDDNQTSDRSLDAWLAAALQVENELRAQASAAPLYFVERCVNSSLNALSINRLRLARERSGFVPLPLADYLRGLSQIAHTSIEPIYERLGLTDIVRPESQPPSALAQLAHLLDFPPRTFLLHI